MAALSPEEQKVFDALVAKQTEVVPEKLFSEIGDVISYLVRTHPGFSENPELRQEALDVVEATYSPKQTVNEGN